MTRYISVKHHITLLFYLFYATVGPGQLKQQDGNSISIYFLTHLWNRSICRLSWRFVPQQDGYTYLCWRRCVQCGRDSVSTGMTMENLIITVIFIPGKYSCGSAKCCSIAGAYKACPVGNRNDCQESALSPSGCCDTAVYKPLTGVILALMSTSGERYVENWYSLPIKH